MLMDGRQRKTVNYFSKYVIDDEAVQRRKADVKKTKVADGQDHDLKQLYKHLDLRGDKIDQILFYEVTGTKPDGMSLKYDSSDSEGAEDQSAKSSSDGSDSDIASPNHQRREVKRKVKTPKSTTSARRAAKMDVDEF